MDLPYGSVSKEKIEITKSRNKNETFHRMLTQAQNFTSILDRANFQKKRLSLLGSTLQPIPNDM